MIAYIFKSSLSLILLFVLYWFLLRKEKLFIFNRFFLVLSVGFSLILPFISIPVNFQTTHELKNIIPAHSYIIPEISTSKNIISPDINIEPSSVEIQPLAIDIPAILIILYISGALLFLLRFLKNIYYMYRQIKFSEKIRFEGYRLVLTNEKTNPYCFFNNIFLNKSNYLNGRIDNDLLSHELMHITQYHSVDIVFLELVRIFYWFNPIYLLYDRAIRINHEYLADHGVIHDDNDIKSYSDKILSFIFSRSNFPLTSGSNHSFTRRRVLMMTKTKSKSSIYGLRITITLSIIMVFSLFLSFKKSNIQPSNEEPVLSGLTDLQAQTVKDIDGNEYKTITIGTQVWMAENLKTTKYNDRTDILLITDDEAWKALTTPAYCWFHNKIVYKDPYGALYNWYAVNTNKLCPTGWHVPSDAEWSTLTNYLGGFAVAGGKLKETNTIHWQSPNTVATNESGFTALSNGFRDINGSFCYEVKVPSYDKNGKIILCRDKSYWWSATEDSINSAPYYSLIYNYGSIYRGSGGKKDGFPVRCLKDNFNVTSNSSINSGEILHNIVRGIVSIEDGVPLPGATISTTLANNSSIETISDFDGRFNLNDVQPGASLIIEYRGFKAQTITADFLSEMVVKLVRDPNFKSDITIDVVQTVSFRYPDFNPANALVVIDGVITDYIDNLKVKPHEMRSFKALKDIDALKKYGEKGKDGVIEITTYGNKIQSGVASDSSKYKTFLSINQVTNNGELIDIPIPNLQYVTVWIDHYLDKTDKKELRFISIMTRDYFKVKGKVVQGNGKPLSGGNISLSDNPVTSISDKEGHFVIGDVRENALLEFSHPGFEPSYINTSFVPFTMELTIELKKDGAIGKDDIYVTAEKMPEYPGGDMEFRKFIATNMNYPEEARAQKAEGVVIVRFVVNTEGNIEDVKLLQRVHPALDTEALRVVSKLDRFIPGSQGGKLVRVYYNLSITFGLPKTNTP